MLDLIRSNTQSFGIKLAFGVIILVFVFWGIGSITDTGSINVVGMVNGHPITFQHFETTYRNVEEATSRQNGGARLSDAQKSQLGRSVFNDLVAEELLCQEAERNNISVSPLELRLQVGTIKAFQDDKGKFDPDLYTRLLTQQRQSPAQFEEKLKRQLLREKVMTFISGGVWSSPMESRLRFNYLRQHRTVDYVFISSKDAAATVKASEEDCKKYYDAHKNDFAVPQKVKVQYILVDPLKLVTPESLSEEVVKKWYDEHPSRYETPKSVEASHILVSLAENASEADVQKASEKIAAIQAELAQGAKFATLADKYNEPRAAGKGGKLGWITPGMTVPPFEKAAFGAEKGKVTGPVRSQFGLHLILVENIREAGIKPFAEVEGEIRKTLANAQGKDRISDVLDTLAEENILGKAMKDSAAKFGLTAEETDLCSSKELQSKLNIKENVASTVMATSAGHPVDTPLEAGEAYAIVRVLESVPASFKEIKDIHEELVKLVIAEKGVEAGRTLLEAALKEGKGSLPESWKGKIQNISSVDRDGAIGPFKAQAQLSEALFNAEVGTWLPTVYAVSTDKETGTLICKVSKIEDPSDTEWQQVEGFMTDLMQRERLDGMYQAFMQDLLSRSEVKVMNTDIITRKNM